MLTSEPVHLDPGIPTRHAGFATTLELSRNRVILSVQTFSVRLDMDW